MFPDYIEIENPGGLYRGLTVEDLGKRSVRRNRLIADLLQRSGFVERVGSGFSRMKIALAENNNPPLEVCVTNFFNIRFYKRLEKVNPALLSPRQVKIYRLLCDNEKMSKKEIVNRLDVSEDTVLRELNQMIELQIVTKTGKGKSVIYKPNIL
jgi:ATP-dependent DNA helicase RecG